MNKIYLLAFYILIQISVQAQDSDLYRTWYLQSIYIEFGDTFEISQIEPSILPILILDESMSHTGNGACNSFEGNFYLTNDGYIGFDDFSQTLLDCNDQYLNDFETIYFYLCSGEENFPYEFHTNPDSGQLELWIGSSTSVAYRFSVVPPIMNSNEFSVPKLSFYPNPATDFIRIENADKNEDYKIFNLNGQFIAEGKLNHENKIDLEKIQSGNYFLVIGNERIKFIKK